MFGREISTGRRIGIVSAMVVAAGLAALIGPQAAMAQSAPPAYPVQGIDTSHWNHSSSSSSGKQGSAINWTSVKNAGKRFDMMKATQGTSYVDPWFTTDFAGARSAGVYVSPYHFWDQSAGTGTAQANHFLAELKAVGYTGLRQYEMAPMLDLEGCPSQTTVANVKSFLTTVANALGVTPMVYTSKGEYTNCLSANGISAYPLVVADWSDNPPRLPADWTSFIFWQYTDSITVSGVPLAVDGDVWYSTQSKLDLFAHNCQTNCPQ
jgi:lysozyme